MKRFLGRFLFPKITLDKPNRLGFSLLMETTTSLNATDLKNYSANEVASLADIDKWAVRDEGIRRQELAEKKLAKLRKQIAAAELEMADAHRIITAANNAQ